MSFIESQIKVGIPASISESESTNQSITRDNSAIVAPKTTISKTVENEETNVEKKRKTRGGDDKFEKRKELNAITDFKMKVQFLLQCKDSLPEKNKRHETCRSWINGTLNPIIGCFESHFQNDLDQFAKFTERTFPGRDVPVSQFITKCCHGKSNEPCKLLASD